jgi:hypothetical protein
MHIRFRGKVFTEKFSRNSRDATCVYVSGVTKQRPLFPDSPLSEGSIRQNTYRCETLISFSFSKEFPTVDSSPHKAPCTEVSTACPPLKPPRRGEKCLHGSTCTHIHGTSQDMHHSNTHCVPRTMHYCVTDPTPCVMTCDGTAYLDLMKTHVIITTSANIVILFRLEKHIQN